PATRVAGWKIIHSYQSPYDFAHDVRRPVRPSGRRSSCETGAFIAIVITSTAAGDVKPKCGTIFIRPGFGYDLFCRGPVAELADALDSKSSSERSVGSSPTRAIFFIYDFRFWVGR